MSNIEPREVLGKYLASKGFPESLWDDFFSDAQKEYWHKRADELIEFIRENEIL